VAPTFRIGYGRSVGLADMAYSIQARAAGGERPFRANGDQAYLVLDLMAGFFDSARTGQAHVPTIGYNRPAPMRADLPFGVLE
jgi:hypothetical protein